LSEQRREIGQELHDNLGQQLTGLGFLAQGLSGAMSGSSVELQEGMRRLVSGLQQALADLRELSHGLVEDEEPTDGLAQTLDRLVTKTDRSTPTDCSFERRQEADVRAPAAARHLCRIAQEAMQNALRHADPGSIGVVLSRNEGRVTLEIHDDGRGFPRAGARPEGCGLSNMRKRANEIGAVLDIRSAQNFGTVVACTLPEEAA
jgi:signal transduction histidine kinase